MFTLRNVCRAIITCHMLNSYDHVLVLITRSGTKFTHWLTLNMLNCFKGYKRCIHISYHIVEFVLLSAVPPGIVSAPPWKFAHHTFFGQFQAFYQYSIATWYFIVAAGYARIIKSSNFTYKNNNTSFLLSWLSQENRMLVLLFLWTHCVDRTEHPR